MSSVLLINVSRWQFLHFSVTCLLFWEKCLLSLLWSETLDGNLRCVCIMYGGGVDMRLG